MKKFLLLLFLSLPLAAFSAQTGKIAGKVTDIKTGESIPGANIVLENTRLGASCGLDGEYYILNVPPGVYTLIASSVSHKKQIVTGVIVYSGQTTWYNLKLEPSVLEMEEVTVTFQQPPVNVQETAMRSTVRKESIEELPVETIEQVLQIQAGAVTGSDGQLHLRGGRSGEVTYYIDGLRVEDPIDGASPLLINREAVEELSVLSGTFNAEYGDAMSGVVQIITRDGTEKFHGTYEYTSPMLNHSPYRKIDWASPGSDAVRNAGGGSLYSPTSVGDEPLNVLPVQGRNTLSVSGPLQGVRNTTFFLSSLVQNENSPLPFGYEQNRSVNGKITRGYGQGGKISLSGGWSWSDYQNYSHAWKYVPDHYHKHFVRDKRLDFQLSHPISKNLVTSLRAGYHKQNHDVKIFEEWEDYLTSDYQPKDFTFASFFYDSSDWSDTYRESSSNTWSLAGDAVCQYGFHHQFKSGFEARTYELNMLDIREMDIVNDQPSGIIDTYEESPVEFSAYLQDKIELPYLIVNAGLRYDYANPRAQSWADPENPDSGLVDAPVSHQFSPRLGLAHPITEDMSLYFAYGHFFQYPYYANLFANSVDLNPDTLSNRAFDAVGNRSLKPQRTIAYEVGLKGNVSEDVGFTITAYSKDITDLVGTKMVRVGTKYHYALFRNIDYASVQGIELGLSRRMKNGWSFEGNYAYSVAKGNSSEPLTGFWNAYYNMPEARQEYYLDFDRRHVLNGMIVYQTGKYSGFNYKYLNSAFSDITLGVIASFASGLPYTPYTGAGEQLAVPNSARMDPTYTVDLRFSKVLWKKPVKVTFLTYVDNVFDHVNDLFVNSQTGQPWDAPLVGNDIAYDQLHDPGKVDIPRAIKIGLNVEM